MESPAARDRGRSTAETISSLKAPGPPVDGDPMSEHATSSELRVQLERQAQDLAERRRELAELRARLYRREQELGEARAVSELLLRSRVYRLMRALGRWGWLEHRIRRALQ